MIISNFKKSCVDESEQEEIGLKLSHRLIIGRETNA